jgi:site-specific recombinase XerC
MATAAHEAVSNSKLEFQAMQIHVALDQFLVQLQADGRSAHTAGQYRRHLALLTRWCAQEGLSGNVEDLDHQALARFLGSSLARMRPDGQPKAATSMNALRSSVRAFFAYSHQAGLISANPARLVRRALCSEGPPRALSQAQEEGLVAVLDAGEGWEARRDRLAFLLMLRCGLRLGSVIALDAADCDLDQGVLAVWLKNARRERVDLPPDVRDELAAFLAGRGGGAVFTNQAGRRLSARHLQRRFQGVAKAAGLPAGTSCHGLRHSFATALLRRTGNVELVRRALNHRSASSTAIYLRVEDGELRAALGA